MKKQNIVIGVILLIFIICIILISFKKKDDNEDNNKKIEDTKFVEINLMEFGEFKNIKLDNIKSIDKVRYTEGGDIRNSIDDSNEIEVLFNSLSKIKLVGETDMTCDDNTTVYIFHLKDDSVVNITIECNWLVVNNKRYLIK